MIGVVGLGYVGLPIAKAFEQHFKVFGFDVDLKRVDELKAGYDRTNEFSKSDLLSRDKLFITSNLENLADCKYFILAVPTPIDSNNKPDLVPLETATKMVGSVMGEGSTIIFESTVYPGCT